MIERYSRKVMRDVWTEQNKFSAYLKVEILASEAWSKLGVVPAEDVEKLWAKASFSIDRIKEIEEQTRHDVVAFTRAVSETLGEERKWVHYGLTSTDVVDTAAAQEVASFITPVPGGVGPMTITMLMKNTIECYLNRIAK